MDSLAMRSKNMWFWVSARSAPQTGKAGIYGSAKTTTFAKCLEAWWMRRCIFGLSFERIRDGRNVTCEKTRCRYGMFEGMADKKKKHVGQLIDAMFLEGF